MFSHLPSDSKIHRGVSTMPIDVYKADGYEFRGGRIMEFTMNELLDKIKFIESVPDRTIRVIEEEEE
jgi:hypothetical protein